MAYGQLSHSIYLAPFFINATNSQKPSMVVYYSGAAGRNMLKPIAPHKIEKCLQI